MSDYFHMSYSHLPPAVLAGDLPAVLGGQQHPEIFGPAEGATGVRSVLGVEPGAEQDKYLMVAPEVSLSDELLAERRLEANRESEAC